jgi:hypothetical protein
MQFFSRCSPVVLLLISPSHKWPANEPVKSFGALPVGEQFFPALDLARGADECRRFVDGGLTRRHHVLRDELAELRIPRLPASWRMFICGTPRRCDVAD